MLSLLSSLGGHGLCLWRSMSMLCPLALRFLVSIKKATVKLGREFQQWSSNGQRPLLSVKCSKPI